MVFDFVHEQKEKKKKDLNVASGFVSNKISKFLWKKKNEHSQFYFLF